MAKIKADFHMHGLIGFEDSWRKVQGYEGKSLGDVLADEVYEKNIGVVAITSEQFDIPKGSVHDRYYQILQAVKDSGNYKTEDIGENIAKIQKEGQTPFYLLNSQTAVVQDPERIDLLILGSNQVPNKKSLEETLDFCEENGLPTILEHPYSGHFGAGEKRAETYQDRYDAIEGFNAQMALPGWLEKIPLIGKKLSKYTEKNNAKAKTLANRLKKPAVATSDAHRPEHLGISYIEFDEEDLNPETEEAFLQSLKTIISEGKFTTHEKKAPIPEWIGWTGRFYGKVTYDSVKQEISSKYNSFENKIKAGWKKVKSFFAS